MILSTVSGQSIGCLPTDVQNRPTHIKGTAPTYIWDRRSGWALKKVLMKIHVKMRKVYRIQIWKK
ncbi:MAG: hypothetical protein WCA39_15875 [Nitrososphaeraceae archaeon]